MATHPAKRVGRTIIEVSTTLPVNMAHLSLSPKMVSDNSTPTFVHGTSPVLDQEDRSTSAWTSASTNASWANSMRLALSRAQSNESPPVEEDGPNVNDPWGEVAHRASVSTSVVSRPRRISLMDSPILSKNAKKGMLRRPSVENMSRSMPVSMPIACPPGRTPPAAAAAGLGAGAGDSSAVREASRGGWGTTRAEDAQGTPAQPSKMLLALESVEDWGLCSFSARCDLERYGAGFNSLSTEV